MMVWANQLDRSSGPSTVSLKSFCALIWSSQLIGGMRRFAPSAAVLKASVTSASARSPLPELTMPSRIAYQRPISSSRALSCATRLRSLSRARKAGCRQAEYLRSCANPHRMIWNFIAESMIISSPDCAVVFYFRPFGPYSQYQKRRSPPPAWPSSRCGCRRLPSGVPPDVGGNRLHQLDLVGRVLGSQHLAAAGDAGKSALRRQAELTEIDMLGSFVDASLGLVLGLELGRLRAD